MIDPYNTYQKIYSIIEKGFDNVINLKGGVDQWADDIDTSMPKYGMKEILENS